MKKIQTKFIDWFDVATDKILMAIDRNLKTAIWFSMGAAVATFFPVLLR